MTTKYRFMKKTSYLNEKEIENEEFNKITTDVWREFRPPLESFNLDIDITNYEGFKIDLIISELEKKNINILKINTLINTFLENEYVLSLKYIEVVNNEINKNDIENTLFDPAPLDNFCCLQTIQESYSYLDFFENKKYLISQ